MRQQSGSWEGVKVYSYLRHLVQVSITPDNLKVV